MTVADILQNYKSSLLKIYDAAEARAIIRLVFEKHMGLDALRLEMNKFQLLTTHQQFLLENTLNRLLSHEPVQYVLGEADFMGMKIAVNTHVLIPRPETEDLVRWVANSATENFSGTILDIGTGSGCIPIALKKLLPSSKISACDICTDALFTATENALANNVELDFFRLDVLSESLPENYHIIVSNPPYIPLNESQTLARHVRDFEPHLALFTPANDAMIFYERISSLAAKQLHHGGKVFFECHSEKANEVAEILRRFGFVEVEKRSDLFGKSRMVAGRKV